MADELHGDAGKEFLDDGCPAIIDGAGVVRKLGALPEPVGLKSDFTLFEDAFPLLSDDEIRGAIANGPKNGRDYFDESWICNQQQFGSCNGWASAKALEATRERKGLPRVKLSGSSVYARVNGGRDNGSIPEEAVAAMQKFGAVPEGPSRVNEIFMSQYTAADWEEAARYKAGECYITRDRQAFLTGIALGFDAVVAVHAGNRYMRVDGDGVAGADVGGGNHAVRIDGAKVLGDRILLDSPGSWDVTYGTRGRCYLTWEQHLARCVGNFRFYLVRTAAEDPRGQQVPTIKE